MLSILQIDKNKGDKGGFMSMGSGRIESSFSDMSISSSGSGFGSSSGLGLTTDVDSFSTKTKGLSDEYSITCIGF